MISYIRLFSVALIKRGNMYVASRAPVIPILAIIALSVLYNIVYAIWIVYRKQGSVIGGGVAVSNTQC